MSVLLQWILYRCCVQVKINLTAFSIYDAANIIIQSSSVGWLSACRQAYGASYTENHVYLICGLWYM